MIKPRDNQVDENPIGVTEGVRRTTGVTPIAGRLAPPDPEVKEKKSRRRFTAQYKTEDSRRSRRMHRAGPTGGLVTSGRPVFLESDQVATTAGGRAPVRLDPTAKRPETETEKPSRRTRRPVGKSQPESRKSVEAGQSDH